MMRSLYSAVSGLRNHQTRMDVIGNNISNVNTVAFKSSSVTFSDIVYQTLSGASGANANIGGVNAKQIGLGMSTAATSMAITSAGSAQSTGGAFDLRIADGGSSTNFFIVNTGTEQVYTRDGSFYIDGAGTLCMSSTGYQVMGWGVNQETGDITQGELKALKIMETENLTSAPEATTNAYVYGIIDKGTSDVTSSTGYTMELTFYDNEGYAYNARFKVTAKDVDAGQYHIKLSQILDQEGVDILPDIEGANNITLERIFGTMNEKPVQLDSGLPARANYPLTTGTAVGTKHKWIQRDDTAANAGVTSVSDPISWNLLPSNIVGMVAANTSSDGTSYLVGNDGNFYSYSTSGGTPTLVTTVGWQDFYADNGGSAPYDNVTVSVTGSTTNLTLQWTEGGTQSDLRTGWYFVPQDDAEKTTAPLYGVEYGTSGVTWGNTTYPNPATTVFSTGDKSAAGYFVQPSQGTFYVVSTDGVLYEWDNTTNAYYQSTQTLASIIKDFDIDQDGITIDDTTMRVNYTYYDMNFHTSDGSFDNINNDPKYATLAMAGLRLKGASESPFENIQIDFSKLQNVANNKKSNAGMNSGESATSTIGAGKKLGNLIGVAVQNDGRIFGSYDNGNTVLLGQIAAAQFSNASGLQKVGDGCYQTTLNSGEVQIVDISADGSSMSSGELEMSNVDLSAEFTDMITTQRGFQANSRVITTSDSMLEELINLKR